MTGRAPDDGEGASAEPAGRDQDPFGGLADGTRIELLACLATGDTPLSYADLFERSSADDRGRFNYHLRQLRGEYVRKTDRGYELARRGLWATNVLAAGVLEEGDERPFREVDSACGRCGHSPVEVGYRDGEGIVRCERCDRTLTRFDFPPGAARRLGFEAFVDAFARRTRAYVGLADDGVCPFCSHRTTSAIRPASATRPDGLPVVYECSECAAGISAPLGLALSTRPRVSARLVECGVDLDATPFWEHEWCTFSAPSVHQTDPLVASLELPGDEDWSVLVDANVDIRDRSR